MPRAPLAVLVTKFLVASPGQAPRPAPLVPLAPARRKVETERLARTALRRLVTSGDASAIPPGA